MGPSAHAFYCYETYFNFVVGSHVTQINGVLPVDDGSTEEEVSQEISSSSENIKDISSLKEKEIAENKLKFQGKFALERSKKKNLKFFFYNFSLWKISLEISWTQPAEMALKFLQSLYTKVQKNFF